MQEPGSPGAAPSGAGRVPLLAAASATPPGACGISPPECMRPGSTPGRRPRLGGQGPRCEAAAGAAGTAGPVPSFLPPRPSCPLGGLRSRPVAGPRLSARTPGGVLRSPLPAPAPRAAGPQGDPGEPAAASLEELYKKSKSRPPKRDCREKWPGTRRASLKRPRKRKRGGKLGPPLPPLLNHCGRDPGGRPAWRSQPRFLLSNAPGCRLDPERTRLSPLSQRRRFFSQKCGVPREGVGDRNGEGAGASSGVWPMFSRRVGVCRWEGTLVLAAGRGIRQPCMFNDL